MKEKINILIIVSPIVFGFILFIIGLYDKKGGIWGKLERIPKTMSSRYKVIFGGGCVAYVIIVLLILLKQF